jgi:hypothetical protein
MIYCQVYSANYQLQIAGRNAKEILFLTNDARMPLKTKVRCGKLAGEAGMSMKTK